MIRPLNGSSTLRRLIFGIAAVTVLAMVAAPAASAASVVNGGFETGTLDGWSVFRSNQDVGWEVLNAERAGSTPGGKIPPIEGAYSAYSEAQGPGTATLYQEMTLEPNQTDQFGLEFAYSSEGPMVTPAGGSLEVQEGVPNEQVRVDVMKATAPLESVDPADILATLFASQTGAPQEVAPEVLSADLSQFAGQAVRLRFAMATDSGRLNAVVDGVTVTSGPIVPPPVVTPVPTSPPAPSNFFTEGKLTLKQAGGEWEADGERAGGRDADRGRRAAQGRGRLAATQGKACADLRQECDGDERRRGDNPDPDQTDRRWDQGPAPERVLADQGDGDLRPDRRRRRDAVLLGEAGAAAQAGAGSEMISRSEPSKVS